MYQARHALLTRTPNGSMTMAADSSKAVLGRRLIQKATENGEKNSVWNRNDWNKQICLSYFGPNGYDNEKKKVLTDSYSSRQWMSVRRDAK